jgi:tRNA-dependent cyclodipeptide synthase
MKISRSIGIPVQEILNKQHNLWIGISFGNKFFNSENLVTTINFALSYTKDKILIWIPGRLQATNYRYFEKLSRAKALKKAFEDELIKKQNINYILQSIPDQDKIVLANYDDLGTKQFINQKEVLYREYSKEELFYDEVIEVVRDIVKVRNRTDSKDRLESLSLYIIQELPLFLDAVRTTEGSEMYTVILYPGLGKLDELVEKIKTGDQYKNLRDNLKIKHQTGIADIIN